jgi:hypothetical protein
VREIWLRLLYCAIGIPLIVTACVIGVRREHRIATGRQTTGTVIRLDHATGGDSDSGYRAVARFIADDGTAQLVQSTVVSHFPPALGTDVPVNYPAGHPEQARIVDWMGRWFDITVIAGLGAMMLLIGVLGRSSDQPGDAYSSSW